MVVYGASAIPPETAYIRAMVNLKIETEALAKKLAFSKTQTQKLLAVTLTQAAYNVQKEIQDEMKRVFRDPTQFVLRSVYVRQSKVTGETVTAAIIGIRGSTGGKVAPSHTLFAEVEGGVRRKKSSEYQLAKVAPQGFPQWVPGKAAPLTAGHDIQAAFMQRILSAMQAQSDPIANSRIKGSTGITARDLFRGGKMGTTLKRGKILEGLRGYDPTFREQMIQKQNRLKKNGQTAGANFFMGPTRKSKDARVLYQFEWEQRPGKRTPNNINPLPVLVKKNVRPILFFTKPQTYKVKLPIGDIAKRVADQDVRRIANDQALRLFTKWNSR